MSEKFNYFVLEENNDSFFIELETKSQDEHILVRNIANFVAVKLGNETVISDPGERIHIKNATKLFFLALQQELYKNCQFKLELVQKEIV